MSSEAMLSEKEDAVSAETPQLSQESTDIQPVVETITPEDAEIMLLTANDPKRDERAVAVYAQAMKNNGWVLNGMPIIFDENGSLIDGVQRLNACIDSEIPFKTFVARGVRADTLHTIDQHRGRTYAGVLESRGIEDAGALVRTMRKLIAIENGTLNRDPLAVGWARYDRVLEKNPELMDAAAWSNEYKSNVIHSTPRPILFFQAMRADKRTELRSFMANLEPGAKSNAINAATQARMRLSGWSSDKSLKIDADKILGNVVQYFDAFCEGETLPDNFVWNPDFGRVRDGQGRWVKPDRPVRFDRADGLTHVDMRRLNGEIDATDKQLYAIAVRLLRGREDMEEGDYSDEIDIGLPDRLNKEEFNKFLKPAKSLRKRLQKQARRRLVEKAAPLNLGMPVVTGYPGLRDAIVDRDRKVEHFIGQVSEDVQKGAQLPTGNASARMVVVTPEMAEKWLSKKINSRNRKIQKNHIKGISRDITADRWMVNAQPISFTADPFDPDSAGKLRLLNGQHRLYAIIDAGIPVELLIAVNIPEEAFPTFDNHAKRQIRPTGNRVDNRVLAAAARLQWKEDQNLKLMESNLSPTASELIETIEAHPGLGKFFARSRRAGMQDIGSAGILTYFFYRVSREASDIAPQFLDDLEYGEGLSAQNPALLLREEIFKAGKISRRETLAMLLSGWNAYKTWRRKDTATAEQQDMF